MDSNALDRIDSDPEEPDVDILAAMLRSDLTDVNAFVEGLAVKLEEMLPGLVGVQRVKQGFRGPKLVSRIQLVSGDESLELRRSGANIETVKARTSGGITLKSEQLDIDAWLGELSKLIAAAAAKSDRARQALQRVMLDG